MASRVAAHHSSQTMNTRSWSQLIAQICDDPSASYWLKNAIRSLAARDPVDAAKDAEILVDIMRARISELVPLRVQGSSPG
jgi:hypothetical protein